MRGFGSAAWAQAPTLLHCGTADRERESRRDLLGETDLPAVEREEMISSQVVGTVGLTETRFGLQRCTPRKTRRKGNFFHFGPKSAEELIFVATGCYHWTYDDARRSARS